LHGVVVAAWQVPVPLHMRADDATDRLHDGPAHCVPAA
jgi:hypothetical protein